MFNYHLIGLVSEQKLELEGFKYGKEVECNILFSSA